MTPFEKVMSNKIGRVHISDLSQPLDEVHKLQLMFERIERKDVGKGLSKIMSFKK